MIKFYCEQCKKCVPVEIGKLVADNLNKAPWTDVVCKDCRFVIATISSEKEGELVFKEDTENE